MASKGIVDDCGTFRDICKDLPPELYPKLIAAIAELENNENYVNHTFPISQLHFMTNIKGEDKIYRFYIDKMSGWRIMAKAGKDHRLHLCGLSDPSYHDDANAYYKSHKTNFNID